MSVELAQTIEDVLGTILTLPPLRPEHDGTREGLLSLKTLVPVHRLQRLSSGPKWSYSG